MKTTPTTIRLDDDLKKELTKELSSMGLSINGYFNLAARQLVIQKKFHLKCWLNQMSQRKLLRKP